MRMLIAAILATCVFSTAASACINDKELIQHEREFRSQYLAPQMTSNSTRLRASPTLTHVGLRVAGAAMLGIAFGSVWKRHRGK